MPVSQADYERATAIISHAVITKSVTLTYPDLTMRDRDEMIISIIDRMARMRGWAIKRDLIPVEDVE